MAHLLYHPAWLPRFPAGRPSDRCRVQRIASMSTPDQNRGGRRPHGARANDAAPRARRRLLTGGGAHSDEVGRRPSPTTPSACRIASAASCPAAPQGARHVTHPAMTIQPGRWIALRVRLRECRRSGSQCVMMSFVRHDNGRLIASERCSLTLNVRDLMMGLGGIGGAFGGGFPT